LITTIILGWLLPSLAGRVKTIRQLKHLRECVSQIGKLDRNSMEDKIKGYYVHGKISEEHRQFLKDKISESYDNVKGSESGG